MKRMLRRLLGIALLAWLPFAVAQGVPGSFVDNPIVYFVITDRFLHDQAHRGVAPSVVTPPEPYTAHPVRPAPDLRGHNLLRQVMFQETVIALFG